MFRFVRTAPTSSAIWSSAARARRTDGRDIICTTENRPDRAHPQGPVDAELLGLPLPACPRNPRLLLS
jgi:hypothetical protein